MSSNVVLYWGPGTDEGGPPHVLQPLLHLGPETGETGPPHFLKPPPLSGDQEQVMLVILITSKILLVKMVFLMSTNLLPYLGPGTG